MVKLHEECFFFLLLYSSFTDLMEELGLGDVDDLEGKISFCYFGWWFLIQHWFTAMLTHSNVRVRRVTAHSL